MKDITKDYKISIVEIKLRDIQKEDQILITKDYMNGNKEQTVYNIELSKTVFHNHKRLNVNTELLDDNPYTDPEEVFRVIRITKK